MQKPDNPQEEILIMEIIFILLKYKFYILILTFLFTICSYFYLKDANYGYTATLDIRKIPIIDTLEYQELSFFKVTHFTLTNDDLKETFESMWKEAGINGLNGHRSVGGYRASMYNALSLDSVKVLVEVMSELESKA